MSNTSTNNDKTVGDDAKVKLIIGEIGRDTKTGIIGRGYSFDNGNTFHVTDTIFGRLYDDRDADGIWNNGMHEKVKEKVNQEITNTVEPAIKQADSAVAYANEAIEKSRVNSQAIVDINSAVSDAVSDAAVARSDGLRAWNAAQSNVGLIDSNYASASAAISSARTEAIAAADEAKAAASAAQADFDTKFADMAGNINALQVDASGMKQTLVSAKGDISTLQATATGFKNTLTDAQGNISTLQSDVVGLKKTTSDHAGNIATLQADAKTLISQISDVQGDISTLQQAAEDTDAKITANSTAIDQNKKAIAFKADQTTVDKTNETVQQLQAQFKVQADQIATKVSSSDLNAKGYATQTYTQTLVTQKANEWNLNLTSLKTDVNAIKTTGGGVNLLQGTRDFAGISTQGSKVAVTNGQDKFQAVTGTQSSSATYYDIACFSSVPLKKDTDYTTSFWVKTSENTDIWSFLFNSGSNGNYADGATKNQSTTDYTRVVVHFHNGNNTATPNFIPVRIQKPGVTVWLYGCMLEEGTVAHTWSLAPSDMVTVTSVTNLSATVDGIKSTVATKADQSEVTQLSNLVQTKVSSGDFTSTTTQLKNLINQRVQVGDVISQINQEAGGDTLIQVSNGKKSLILDAGNTIVTGKAWIPVASIADLTADQIQAGTLTGSTVHLGDSNGNTIDLGVLGTNHVGLHSSAQNGDQTYIDCNGIHNYGASYDTKISQGKITTGYMTVNGGGLIDFRSSGNGTTIDSRNIKFYNSNAVNGGIEFSGGSPLATVRDGTVGNELRVRYDRSFALTPIKDESARICASSAAMQVGFVQSGRSTPDRQTTGFWVDGDKRHVNLGVWGADSTWARVEANTHNIHMQADKAHAWLSSDNVFHIYKDGDSSSTATKLQVDGWAWVNGWVEAAGHSQHSALSTKTDIQSVDDDKMLEMVNNTDLTSFLYTSDVANGETHRHIGLIIDDVHDVAQYQTPQEFIAPNGVSRDDDNMIGALFGAVKALTKRIKTLESKVG